VIIIGLQGKKGVGKNFVASIIQQQVFTNKKVLICAFADPIKEFLAEIVGLNKENLYGNDDQKNEPTPYLWENMPIWLREKFKSPHKYISFREMLQLTGTEIGREVWGHDLWIKAMHRRILESDADVVVVSDCRFQEEVNAVHEWGGKVWRIKGQQRGKDKDNIKNDSHISEKVMDSTTHIDYVLENSPEDTPETLAKKIREAMLHGAL